MAALRNTTAYLKYLHAHEKSLTRLYDEGRYIAFEESYQWIESRVRELNHSASSYKVVVNQFADWSQHEISQMFPVFNYSTDRVRNSGVPAGWEALGSVGPGLEGRDQSSFSGSLNWATDHNPQGVSVVAGPRNQGMCGACWAFVAAGSAEGAVGISTGRPVTLSVQELIDCSTEFNRGCNGGNPMFAYDYIREYGLSLWKEYPYADLQNPSCQSTAGYTKAMINYDLQVPPDDEVELKWYVSRGPVAIGVCGTDLDFMYYGGGIFDSPRCCSAQNHAMLIVGYGVDADSDTPYWVVQNSWGSFWGEGGYIRIKRSTVRGGGAGVCGLATFSTMAVGGHLIAGNSSKHADSTSTIGEWLLDHNEQIISVFAAACFLLSIALLILSYWFSCRRRESERSAREAAVSRIKMDAVRYGSHLQSNCFHFNFNRNYQESSKQ